MGATRLPGHETPAARRPHKGQVILRYLRLSSAGDRSAAEREPVRQLMFAGDGRRGGGIDKREGHTTRHQERVTRTPSARDRRKILTANASVYRASPDSALDHETTMSATHPGGRGRVITTLGNSASHSARSPGSQRPDAAVHAAINQRPRAGSALRYSGAGETDDSRRDGGVHAGALVVTTSRSRRGVGECSRSARRMGRRISSTRRRTSPTSRRDFPCGRRRSRHRNVKATAGVNADRRSRRVVHPASHVADVDVSS